MFFAQKIEFPTLLLKELASHHTVGHKPVTLFNFIYRDHKDDSMTGLKFPEDNTPEELVNLRLDDLNFTPNKFQQNYITAYKDIVSFTSSTLSKAITLSNLNPKIIQIACTTTQYEPKALETEVLQHNFMIALHARFLNKFGGKHSKRTPRKYINCIQNHYIHQEINRLSYEHHQINALPRFKIGHLQLNEELKSRSLEFNNKINFLREAIKPKQNIWLNITVTAPGEFHPISANWNGCSPDITNKYFQKKWRNIQDSLQKKKIEFFGFWTLEFHEDGCPHRNFLIVIDKKNYAILSECFLSRFKHSQKAVHIKSSQSKKSKLVSKTEGLEKEISYISKRLFPELNSKNINHKLFDRAIASLYSLRMFGLFGTKNQM